MFAHSPGRFVRWARASGPLAAYQDRAQVVFALMAALSYVLLASAGVLACCHFLCIALVDRRAGACFESGHPLVCVPGLDVVETAYSQVAKAEDGLVE